MIHSEEIDTRNRDRLAGTQAMEAGTSWNLDVMLTCSLLASPLSRLIERRVGWFQKLDFHSRAAPGRSAL